MTKAKPFPEIGQFSVPYWIRLVDPIDNSGSGGGGEGSFSEGEGASN